MLPELLYRDWLLNRRVALIGYGVFFAFQAYAVHRVNSPRAWMIFACIYASFLAVTVFVREDKFQATAWSCTLPVTRLELVRARFAGAWIMVLVALAAALLLATVLPGSIVSVPRALEPTTLLIAVAIVSLVLGLMQPFTIRFGLLGVMFFLIGTQMLGVVLLTASVALQRRHGTSGRPIRDAVAPVANGVLAVRDALSPGLFAALVVVVLAVAHWAAYRLAVYLFRRREL